MSYRLVGDVGVGGPVVVAAAGWSWAFDPAAAGYGNRVNRPFASMATAGVPNDGVGAYPNKVGGSEGWDDVERIVASANFSAASLAGGIISPTTVVRINYPVGLAQNTEPGLMQTWSNPATYGGSPFNASKRIYIRGAFYLGPTYHVGSVRNKLFFVRSNEGDGQRAEPFLQLGNAGGGLFDIGVRFQGCEDGGLGSFMSTTPPGNQIALSTWYGLELLMRWNSAVGVGDGEFHLWINGVLVLQRLNVKYIPAAAVENKLWYQLHVSPTYGGSGVPNPTAFDFYWDHFSVWDLATA